jgi:hypothetical protein
LSGSQSNSGRCVEEKNILPIPGIEPPLLGFPARNLVAIPTKLSRLLYDDDDNEVRNLKLSLYLSATPLRPVGRMEVKLYTLLTSATYKRNQIDSPTTNL